MNRGLASYNGVGLIPPPRIWKVAPLSLITFASQSLGARVGVQNFDYWGCPLVGCMG